MPGTCTYGVEVGLATNGHEAIYLDSVNSVNSITKISGKRI